MCVIYYVNVGIGSMSRFFPPDILHSLMLGFVMYGLSFSLQIISVIGEIDDTFGSAAEKLGNIIRYFPLYQSLHPVREYHFEDIWKLFQSDTSKQSGNPFNTTGLLSKIESWKLEPALWQVMIACTQKDVLPDTFKWSEENGFDEPYFCVRQIICHTLNAVIVVLWYSKADSLSETQMGTFEMLIANAQAHMLNLDMLRRRVLNMSLNRKKKGFQDLNVETSSILCTPKTELISHLPVCKRDSGCDNFVRDTSMQESFMKPIRLLYNTSSKRYWTIDEEMLRKYVRKLYLDWMKKGRIRRRELLIKSGILVVPRVHVKDRENQTNPIVAETADFIFKGNQSRKCQTLYWCGRNEKCVPIDPSVRLNLHKMMCVNDGSGINNLNFFLSYFKDLVHGRTKEVFILKSLLVLDRNEMEEQYQIFSDSSFTQSAYAGCHIGKKGQRYSALEYMHPISRKCYSGQVLVIVAYSKPLPDGSLKRCCILIMQRFCTNATLTSERCLPLAVKTYAKHKTDKSRYTFDCITVGHIRGPFYYVPALDYGMNISDVGCPATGGRNSKNNSVFYTCSVGEVKCDYLYTYADYLKQNTSRYCNVKVRKGSRFINFNAYLTLQEMKEMKDLFFISDNVRARNEDSIDYGLDFDCDDFDMDDDKDRADY